MKTSIKYTFLLLLCLVFASFKTFYNSPPPCKYYCYIFYGEASLTSNIREKEKVYKEVKIFKSEDGYRACCNDYCSNSCSGWRIINIGPFESESICYAELQRQRAKIEAEGYKEYVQYRHMIPGVLDFNYKPCQ